MFFSMYWFFYFFVLFVLFHSPPPPRRCRTRPPCWWRRQSATPAGDARSRTGARSRGGIHNYFLSKWWKSKVVWTGFFFAKDCLVYFAIKVLKSCSGEICDCDILPPQSKQGNAQSSQARLAQSVERETLNLNVVGSSPTLGETMFYFSHKTRLNSLQSSWGRWARGPSRPGIQKCSFIYFLVCGNLI